MTKQELQNLIDQKIYENSNGEVTATSINDVLSGIVDGLPDNNFTKEYKDTLEALGGVYATFQFDPIPSSYIIRTSGLIGSHADYRRTPLIPLAGRTIKIDTGNFGGSVAIVAYYSSTTISTQTWIQSVEIPSTSGPSVSIGTQIIGHELQVPIGATHVIISCHFAFALRVFIKEPKSNSDTTFLSQSAIYTSQNIYNAYDNPFKSISPDTSKLYRRSARLTTIPSDSSPLIIVAGQSNADGRAPIASAPSWLTSNSNKIDNYMVWNITSNMFQSYQLGVNTGSLNNSTTSFGFDIFFAKAWLDANPGKKLYCIKQTKGGVPITEKGSNSGNNNSRWQPKTELITAGELSMCLELIDKVKAVNTYLIENKIKLVPIAVLYHQGEGDADRVAQGGVTEYKVNLANLISWFRGLFQTSSIPFLNGRIINVNTNYTNINTIFGELNALDPNMITVDMTGHETNIGDGLHYDSVALEYMAQQMYLNYLSL